VIAPAEAPLTHQGPILLSKEKQSLYHQPAEPHRQPAQALVELSLVLPVLLIVLLGMIDVGRGLVFGVASLQGAREASRIGALAGLDPTITDAILLERLIAGSAPALVDCSTVLDSPQQCGGGTWTFSIAVTSPSGSSTYPSLAVARAAMPQGIGGSRLAVTARGSVSMLGGLGISAALSQVAVQGKAVMVVL
jgi:TadE-like protein